MYRPISITGPGPKEAQPEDIERIFQPKPKSKFKHSNQDVIYTLSSALENLDQHVADKQNPQSDSSVTEKSDLIKALTQHNDAAPQQGDAQQTIAVRVPNGTVKLVIQEIQNRFRPYNIPPPPIPMSQQEVEAIESENVDANEEALGQSLEAQVESQDPVLQRRSRKKSLADTPIAEVFDSRGESFSIDMDMQNTFFTAHNPEVAEVIEASKRRQSRFKAGNRIRRGFWVPGRTREVMRLISVRRLRKLKMKKHKHKKLMRRTRTLRKREGRL
jgi:hypothetical protein